MKSLSGLMIAIAMLAFGNVTNAQDQRREGDRAERADSDPSDAPRRRDARNPDAGNGDQRQRNVQGRGGQGGQRRGGGQGRGGGGGLFRLLDVDGDGQLSAKEIDGAITVLARLDVNQDGTIDAQELIVRGGGGGQGRGASRGSQGGKGRGGQDAQRRGGGQGERSDDTRRRTASE